MASISRATVAMCFVIAFIGTSAQSSSPPGKTLSLEEILQRLETNLKRYDNGVPSLFCDEHVVSHMDPGTGHRDTVTDSVFRLNRVPNGDHTTTLEESREIRTVNGKAATSSNLEGPSVLSGVFEGALAVVSQSQASCMKYSLDRRKQTALTEPYVVHFATVLTPQNSGDCLLQEKSKGVAFIDTASMQITHLELTTPRHTIVAGDVYSSPVIGKRVLVVDYAPVLLDAETFWMPSLIKSTNVGDPGTFHATVWSFQAGYSNYHKMKVTTRILPGGATPAR